MSCNDVEAAKIWDEAKDPDDTLDYAVSFEKECSRKWLPDSDFVSTSRIRVFRKNQSSGFEFEATVGGRTGGSEPRWPSVIGQTVTDGSVTWTARAITSASLYKTMNGIPTWTAQTTGVTIASPSVLNQTTVAFVSVGQDLEDYTIAIKATFSDGTTKTAICILKVRRAKRVCEA